MTDSSPWDYALLEQQLGHQFATRSLCVTALTHKSWLNETEEEGRTDNERLEFLGDAVLSLCVSDLLMRRFPDRSEGELSKTRAVLVSEAGLAKAATSLGLGEWIFLGRGEEQAGGRHRPSILADALEALVGAVFFDGGFARAQAVAERLFGAAVEEAEKGTRLDYKSRLQERSQARLQKTPTYTVVGEEGPEHAKRFLVAISLDGREYGRAQGRSKKEAEQNAAALALALMDDEEGRSLP